MPQITNVTVKAANGTTDVVYTGVQPSAGGTSPAIWRDSSGAVSPGFQPEMRTTVKSNAQGTVKTIQLTGMYPEVGVVGGVNQIINLIGVDVKVTVPQQASVTAIQEGVHRVLNFAGHAHFKAQCIEGFPST